VHRLPVCDQGGQDQQNCASTLWSCNNTSHRCSLRSYRKRRCKSEGALLYGESTGFDRTGAPRVPARAHGSGQGESPAVSLKNLNNGETYMKDRSMHPNASAFDSAFYSGASAMRELWSRMRSKQTIVLAAAVVLFAGNAWTQENNAVQSQSVATSSGSGEANDTNAANNPAHPLLTVDLWNYFA